MERQLLTALVVDGFSSWERFVISKVSLFFIILFYHSLLLSLWLVVSLLLRWANNSRCFKVILGNAIMTKWSKVWVKSVGVKVDRGNFPLKADVNVSDVTNCSNCHGLYVWARLCMCVTCGVVMMTAPSTRVELRYWTIDRCSSEVPGGVSTMRKSRSPQSTSLKNCLIIPDGWTAQRFHIAKQKKEQQNNKKTKSKYHSS